ncbi:MAG: P-II family nitrogen regulator [Nitriliruptoraceae bacterium]
MKLVTAIVKPHKLDDVRDALRGIGVQGLTVTDVHGFGRQGGHTELYRGAEYKVEFLPKVRVEVLIDDAQTDEAIQAIIDASHTGEVGDGKVFVTPVERIVRIRTGEQDVAAL